MVTQTFDKFRSCCFRCLAVLPLSIFTVAAWAEVEVVLVTGEIEDGNAQSVEMPRLPGSYSRTISWMAPEGELVQPGDPIVELDPGDLESQLEQAEVNIEAQITGAESQEAAHELRIFDATTSLIETESRLENVRLDSMVPRETVPELTYDRNRLALANAIHSLERSIRSLEEAYDARDRDRPMAERDLLNAQNEKTRIENALKHTKFYAEQSGIVIYGENRLTGLKIFPGESYGSGTTLLIVASREDLQFRFWVHEADIRKIVLGDEVVVSPDAVGDAKVRTKVTWMSNQAASRNDWSTAGYYEILTEPLDEIPEVYKPGMSILGVINK
ncbi:MAG: hypothetical protein F4Z01_09710 [Gammaproteobacteria bacterium]|nr:hypothetical protein [Gammaproteobacteria bacterium]MYF38206.1 hypothetical protein [Gammaproteobacteria bacterium]